MWKTPIRLVMIGFLSFLLLQNVGRRLWIKRRKSTQILCQTVSRRIKKMFFD